MTVYWQPRGANWEICHPLADAIETYWDSGCEEPPLVERVLFDPYRSVVLKVDIGSLIEREVENLYENYGCDAGDDNPYDPSVAVQAAARAFAAALCDDYARKQTTACVLAQDVDPVLVEINADGDYTII